jgi:hypothetical protein
MRRSKPCGKQRRARVLQGYKYDEETGQAAMVHTAYTVDLVDEDSLAYDCEVFMSALMHDNPIDLEEADEADDEFLEMQSDEESTDSMTLQSNSSFETTPYGSQCD